MIPIRLTLQGIYSYQEKQTIDFTKLTEANLFGIFGSVGSGKSTILEAITYALYGNTDRLNQKGDNRNYNMMNLKSNELFIEFVFRTGKNDNEYMATVKGRRNSKQFEDVKSLERSAYKKVNGAWEPLLTEDFCDILGLSYENFKRTVIIPQGRFQEFLQLGNSERTRMMKELFNLDRFELYYQVVSLDSKNNQQLQSLEGQLLQIGEISPEQISRQEESLEKIRAEILQKSNNLTARQKQDENLRKIKELIVQISTEEQTLAQLKGQEEEHLKLEQNIREYEYCLLNFSNLLETIRNNTQKIAQFQQSIQADQALLTHAEQQLRELEVSLTGLKTAYENRETHRQKAEELDKIAHIHELDQTCKQISSRIENGEKFLLETDGKINRLQETKEKLETSLKAMNAQMPDLAMLSKARNWFTIQKTLLDSQKQTELEGTALQEEIREMEQKRANAWKSSLWPDMPATEESIERQRTVLKNTLKTLDQEAGQLSIQSRLEEYASNLEEGNACPLCGATSHPSPFNAASVAEALQKLQQQKAGTETALDQFEAFQKELSALSTTLSLKKELLARLLEKKEEQDKRIATHREQFCWENYPDDNSVNQAFETAETIREKLKTEGIELETTTVQLGKESQNREKFNQALEEFRHQLTARTTESTILNAQLNLLKLQDFENTSLEEIQKEKEAFLLLFSEAETAYVSANEKNNVLRKERDTLTGRLEANRQVLQQENSLKADLDNKLNEQLDKSGYKDLTQVADILSNVLDVEAGKARLASYKQSLEISRKKRAELQKELADRPYDETGHRELLEQIQAISEELNRDNQNQGRLEAELKKLKADYQALKSLIEQKNALLARSEDLKTLKQLFKASGFVNYISSVYLHELCHAGNERFYKLTRQKLSLEVTGDNNFQVRDFMNGGKTRNVKTLSGGQTFQAALSLALALADNIQQLSGSNQNFFFLDEGFGSLDKESLDVVFDTLKSLRKENRMVGVISHVEEMQQEIDTHLKIVNDEERGSLIHLSWE